MDKENHVDFIFRDGFTAPFELTGFPWRGKDGFRLRLPEELIPKMQSRLEFHEFLPCKNAGGTVRFITDATQIALKAELCIISPAEHQNSYCHAGLQLVREPGTLQEHIFKPAVPGHDALSLPANVLRSDKNAAIRLETVIDLTVDTPPGLHSYNLHLPPYGCVKSLQIGLPDGAELLPPKPHKVKLPIVFYGSSITQGSSASTPVSAYTTRLCNALDACQINMGFSGSAKGEIEIAQAISRLPMSVFVLDYDHNSPVDELDARHEKFFLAVREARPELPIILVTGPRNPELAETLKRREIIRRTYQNALKRGDKHVRFVNGGDFYRDVPWKYTNVDRTHPTDLGFYLMFKTLLPVLQEVLGI